ncbi:MAG: LysR family transcriptional regulator, repressor for citA [Clostridiales bacterium]|nr:LysR family transcriptional regulator, repressor for citA [Clostridiales bacterium]
MDTNYLNTFIMLAEVGNFTRTSEKLFVAQSTVTNRIAELEKELGKPLFVRGQKQAELTPEGILFLEYARRIVALEKMSLESINRIDKYEDILRIGTTNTIYESYLEKELITYRSLHPSHAVKIILGHSEELLLKLQDKILDVVYSYSPLIRNGFICDVFHKDKLVLVTAYDNSEYQEGIVREDLMKVEYFMCNFKLKGIGAFLTELFPPYQQYPFEIDNSIKMIPFLLAGHGYSLLPETVVEPYVKEKLLRVIPLLNLEAPEIISYRITRDKKRNAVK